MRNKQKYISLIVFLFVAQAFMWLMAAMGYPPNTWQYWAGNGIVWISHICGCVSGGIEIVRKEK